MISDESIQMKWMNSNLIRLKQLVRVRIAELVPSGTGVPRVDGF